MTMENLAAEETTHKCPSCGRDLNFERNVSGVMYGNMFEDLLTRTAYKCNQCQTILCRSCAEKHPCPQCGNREFTVALGEVVKPPSNAKTRNKNTKEMVDEKLQVPFLPMFEWCVIPVASWASNYFPPGRKTYLISKYPITYAQYQVFIDDPNGYHNSAWWAGLKKREIEPGKQEFPIHDHPRENVSWYDAMAFCAWLSDKLGYEVRLPKRTWEWIPAAGGPENYKYPWGNKFDPSRCNTRENGIESTTPVNKYKNGVSAYGVYDMKGNVWEWCWGEFEYGDTPGGNAEFSSLAGGAWGDNGEYTVHKEGGTAPHERFDDHGFRVVGFPEETE